MKLKNVLVKGIVTLLALRFINPVFDILWYALLLQLLLMGGEKLTGILEASVQAKVIATMEKLHLCNKKTKKFVRPCSFLINYIIKFYTHDFTAKAEDEA